MANEKILIAVNNAIVALEIKRNLESCGYLVYSLVSAGVDAVGEIFRLQPDVIIFDMDLNGDMEIISITEGIEELKIPIVFLSGIKEPEILKPYINIPMAFFLFKPFSDEELGKKLIQS